MLVNEDLLSLAERFSLLPLEEQTQILAEFTDDELTALETDWRWWGRPKQLAPAGNWLVWLLRTGRGFGKSRAGSGWFHERMMESAGRWGALIAKNPADARDYMIEGPSGILKNCPPHELPEYIPSLRRMVWPNGSWATIYSSEEPDQVRGFSGDTAWFDELAKYKNPREMWDNVQFGMRELSADQPRIVITTTPRPLPLLEEIELSPHTVTITGSSYENRANLAPTWFDTTLAKYEGTALGAQEILGEMIDAVEGLVYNMFSRKIFPDGNIDPLVRDIGGELIIGQDFNVNPMSSVIMQKVANECHVINAVNLPVSNTQEMCEVIQELYPKRPITFCPDPSGKSRRTSAVVGVTDFTIIQSFGWKVEAPAAAPAVVDRVNNTNAMFYNKKFGRRIRIHPRAEPLIYALRHLMYKEGTSVRDKGSGFDHPCDAFDYALWQRFNLMLHVPTWGNTKRPVNRSQTRPLRR